jgi:hypothetical protein
MIVAFLDCGDISAPTNFADLLNPASCNSARLVAFYPDRKALLHELDTEKLSLRDKEELVFVENGKFFKVRQSQQFKIVPV